MKYMLLLYSAEDGTPTFTSEAEVQAYMEPWMRYTAALQEAGALVGGDALKATATATTVRVRDGDVLTTDGPFAETVETLGGYYLIDVPDLDAALAWAARCPIAPYGAVEVRPLETFA